MLGEKEYPWLESSVAISKTIASLTDDVTTPDPKDLERLFHSCRMEKAVTNETIVLLQHFWQGISLFYESSGTIRKHQTDYFKNYRSID